MNPSVRAFGLAAVALVALREVLVAWVLAAQTGTLGIVYDWHPQGFESLWVCALACAAIAVWHAVPWRAVGRGIAAELTPGPIFWRWCVAMLVCLVVAFAVWLGSKELKHY